MVLPDHADESARRQDGVEPLTLQVVHGEDIRRPLGLSRCYPREAVVRSLRLQTRTPASFGGVKEFVAGVRLTAEDDELDGWRGREASAARPMSQQFNLIARR